MAPSSQKGIEWEQKEGNKRLRLSSAGLSESSRSSSSDTDNQKLPLPKKDVKESKIVVEKLRFKIIEVTEPSSGTREVFYADKEPFSDSDVSDADCYEDWREETVPAIITRKRKRKGSRKEATTTRIQVPREFPYLFQVKDSKDDIHAILDVLSGGPMSFTVLDAYIKHRISQHRLKFKGPGTPTKFRYLSVNFAPVKDREAPPSSVKLNPKYDGPKPRPSQLENAILLAPQYISKHLYLAVFNFIKKSIQVYDSSWHYISMDLRKAQVFAILEELCPDDYHTWRMDFKKKSSPQYDEYSCGTYTILYAENVIKSEGAIVKTEKRNRKEMSKEKVLELRKKIVKELLSTHSQGRRFLQAITD